MIKVMIGVTAAVRVVQQRRRRAVDSARRSGSSTSGRRRDAHAMNVCIVGAGAIGGFLGARMARAGAKVSVAARGATALRCVHTAFRCRPATRPRDAGRRGRRFHDAAVAGFRHRRGQRPALASVAQQIGPLLGPEAAVLPAMNGVPWWFFHGSARTLRGNAARSDRSRRRDRAGDSDRSRRSAASSTLTCVDARARISSRTASATGLIIGETERRGVGAA